MLRADRKNVIVLVVMALCILAAVVWLSLTPGSKALVQEDPAQVESVAFARYGSDGYQEVTRYDDPEAVQLVVDYLNGYRYEYPTPSRLGEYSGFNPPRLVLTYQDGSTRQYYLNTTGTGMYLRNREYRSSQEYFQPFLELCGM